MPGVTTYIRTIVFLVALAACDPSTGVVGVETDWDAAPPPDSEPVCESGEAMCSNDLTAVTCENGEWTVSDTCEPGVQRCQEDRCIECEATEFTIQTMQACSIKIADGFEVDGESFIELDGEDYRVFALDRWGNGHIVAWCDGTTLSDLLAAFNVLEYLGQVENPRVASWGDRFLCDVLLDYSPEIPYLGNDLPATYAGDPAALADDYDVLIFCGFRIPWTHDWSGELQAFVTEHGRGLLAVQEYKNLGSPADFAGLNNVTGPSGILFEPISLDHAATKTSVRLDCVPDLPPIN